MGLGALIPFATPPDWYAWLEANQSESEVWVLYSKKGSGTPSITWQQAVVEALCWGWIDGISKSVSETQWKQRFTPRKPGSGWSQINVAHAERLIAEGRMQPAGHAAIAVAKANGNWERAYSGGKGAELPPDFLEALTLANLPVPADTKTRYAIYYRLTTAKRPETRAKRIADFIAKLSTGAPL